MPFCIFKVRKPFEIPHWLLLLWQFSLAVIQRTIHDKFCAIFDTLLSPAFFKFNIALIECNGWPHALKLLNLFYRDANLISDMHFQESIIYRWLIFKNSLYLHSNVLFQMRLINCLRIVFFFSAYSFTFPLIYRCLFYELEVGLMDIIIVYSFYRKIWSELIDSKLGKLRKFKLLFCQITLL